jgi:parvulin-like peptidyl-prolyl isomerase
MPLLVNGRRVDEDLLNAEFSSIKAYFESLGNVSCCERDDEFRGYARQNMIAKMLLAEEAERRIPPPGDAEIDAEIERLRQEQGDFQFHAMVALAPDQLEGVRRDAAINLRTQKLLEGLWADIPQPSEEELRQFYQDHLQAFMTIEEVRASHISKNPGKGESREQVYAELLDVRRKLLKDGDFDELAREHSDKGKEQVDLGFFKRGEYPEEFELVCFSMEIGELSPIFASTYGYHIAKVTDRKPSVARPFEEVREFVQQLWTDERRKAKTQGLVEQLRATAAIEETAEPAEAAVT